jgi:hypothetical protein
VHSSCNRLACVCLHRTHPTATVLCSQGAWLTDIMKQIFSKGKSYFNEIIFLPVAQQPPVGQGLLIIEASRSHSDTPHSVGLLWTSDQPHAETLLDNTRHSQERHPCPGGIQTRNPSKRTAADPCLRHPGHGDRLLE